VLCTLCLIVTPFVIILFSHMVLFCECKLTFFLICFKFTIHGIFIDEEAKKLIRVKPQQMMFQFLLPNQWGLRTFCIIRDIFVRNVRWLHTRNDISVYGLDLMNESSIMLGWNHHFKKKTMKKLNIFSVNGV